MMRCAFCTATAARQSLQLSAPSPLEARSWLISVCWALTLVPDAAWTVSGPPAPPPIGSERASSAAATEDVRRPPGPTDGKTEGPARAAVFYRRVIVDPLDVAIVPRSGQDQYQPTTSAIASTVPT